MKDLCMPIFRASGHITAIQEAENLKNLPTSKRVISGAQLLHLAKKQSRTTIFNRLLSAY